MMKSCLGLARPPWNWKQLVMSQSFATRWNLDAIEAAYQQWKRDPSTVDDSWRLFFEGFELAQGLSRSATFGGQLGEHQQQAAVVRLIQAYRDLGHFVAHLDPLSEPRKGHPLLELSMFGLTEADLDRSFHAGNFLGLPHGKLRDIIDALRETYCGSVGVEYLHIQDSRIRKWLQERMEPNLNQPSYTRERKLRILKHLYYAELFERFLHTRFVGQKRFSLEGAETMIPILEAIVDHAAELGVSEIIMGMAHRGRLNVLANTLRKPYEEIFTEFEENYLPESVDGDGDVKYHLGFSCDRVTPTGRKIHLSLTPNPSHLEAVNPVVEGRTRAKQTRFNDRDRTLGLPVLMHGDAAFAGQGLVAETINLSELAGYSTGGTIHLIVNNQIGFTTAPKDARSTTYCTDVAKMIQAPIFHVNGEDPEASVFVAELALEFRQTFHRDVVIDMFCYRRHGHNEGDEPSFTQPLMYSKIKDRPTLSEIYTEKLILSGDLTAAEHDALVQRFTEKLQGSLEEVKEKSRPYARMNSFSGIWNTLQPQFDFRPTNTGVAAETLQRLVEKMTSWPEGFAINPKVQAILERRKQDVTSGQGIDWATAELLAFASLLAEGTPVRLSGQDSRRGTFSQRHAVLYDARTGEPYSPLTALSPQQAAFQVYDSLLSEAAVLGFEYGYALDSPETLVMWEAQFGDFVNGAQVIIDQFIVASQSKWRRDSGVTMLLPHGYEGQGPEHSSARLERFLQLCAEDNMQVAYPSTPAQYFHLLRRQMKRSFRKPLVVMTPKSLLRLKACVSTVADLAQGTFQELLDDTTVDRGRVRRVVLCSGKLYYELLQARQQQKLNDVAIVRVEQLYPWHTDGIQALLGRYQRAGEWIWAQEESQNMGAWSFVEPRLRGMGFNVKYVGRDASASPATGSRTIHLREQSEVIETALSGAAPHLVRATLKKPVEREPRKVGDKVVQQG